MLTTVPMFSPCARLEAAGRVEQSGRRVFQRRKFMGFFHENGFLLLRSANTRLMRLSGIKLQQPVAASCRPARSCQRQRRAAVGVPVRCVRRAVSDLARCVVTRLTLCRSSRTCPRLRDENFLLLKRHPQLGKNLHLERVGELAKLDLAEQMLVRIVFPNSFTK